MRFYVDNVDFFTALRLAGRVSKTMWTALDLHQVLIAADTAENHKQYDRMSLATFAVPGASAQQETTELVTSLKTICDFQKISLGQGSTVEVRAPQATLEACYQASAPVNHRSSAGGIRYQIYQINH